MKELIEAFTALEAAIVRTWGQIPGELEAEFKKIASLINLVTPSSNPPPPSGTDASAPAEGAD